MKSRLISLTRVAVICALGAALIYPALAVDKGVQKDVQNETTNSLNKMRLLNNGDGTYSPVIVAVVVTPTATATNTPTPTATFTPTPTPTPE